MRLTLRLWGFDAVKTKVIRDSVEIERRKAAWREAFGRNVEIVES